MVVQIGLSEDAVAPHVDLEMGLHELAPDLAYLRTIMVNVVFIGHPGQGDWVLVDTGVFGTTTTIADAAERRFGTPPVAIVQTHGHFDHVGGLEELSERWNVPVYAHREEMPYLDGRTRYPAPDTHADGGIMPKLAPLFPRAPVNVGSRLVALPDDHRIPPLPHWTWIHTPGHTPGHISLWRERDRTLIAGDAFITTGQESAYAVATQQLEMHGPPRYFTPDWASAGSSVEKLARLEPELAVTGHGRPVFGGEMREALWKLATDFQTIAVPEHLRSRS